MQREAWRRTVPSLITLVRIVLLPVVIIVWLNGDRVIALGIYVALVLTDGIDGWTARRLGSVSRFGAFLDVIADILVSLGLLGMLAWTRATFFWLPFGPLGVALLFLCTSSKGSPRYDPIGRYYGTALFVLIGIMLLGPHALPGRLAAYVIAVLSLFALFNRAIFCARQH